MTQRETFQSFGLTIDIGNDEMRHAEHVAAALERVAKYVRQGIYLNSAQRIADINGNTVGEFCWRKYSK